MHQVEVHILIFPIKKNNLHDLLFPQIICSIQKRPWAGAD